MEVLELNGTIRRHRECRRRCIAITAFEPRPVALAGEAGVELIAERAAAGREPVIGEGNCAGDVSRAEPADAIGAGLQRVAVSTTERIRQAPIGAGAGERKARHRVGREMIIHPAGEAVCAGRCGIRSDRRIAVGRCWRRQRPSPRCSSAAHKFRGGALLKIEAQASATSAGRLFSPDPAQSPSSGRPRAPPTSPRPLTNGSSISARNSLRQLKRHALGAGRHFAVKLRQGVRKATASQTKDTDEVRRQRTASVQDKSLSAVAIADFDRDRAVEMPCSRQIQIIPVAAVAQAVGKIPPADSCWSDPRMSCARQALPPWS